MTGTLLRQLAQRSQPTLQPAASDVLSARECEVLTLVVDGCSNAEIAQELGIARNTVKNHLRSILAKLGARNRVQAAAYAVSQGLVCLPTDDGVAENGGKA
jgi:DNA-binding NarL/FixJ family response regulator